MIGVLIGLAGGALELWLLTHVVKSVTGGTPGKTLLLLLVKFAVLAGAFASVILIRRSELLWCAIALTGVLIVGSVILFIMRQSRSKGGK